MNARGWTRIAVLTALTAALIAAPAAAQQGRNRGEHSYDPATVTTVESTVQEVTLESGRGRGNGVHLVLATEDEPTVVHVAPRFWLDDNELSFAAGDAVTVTGSKTVVNGEPALIAREITVNGASLTLRDESGFPAWRGSGPRATGAGRGRQGMRGAGRGGQGAGGAGLRYRGGRGGGNGVSAGAGAGPHCPGCIGR